MTQNFIYGLEDSLGVIKSLGMEGLPKMNVFESLLKFRRFNGFVEKKANLADIFYIQPFSGKAVFPLDGVDSHTMNSLFTGDNPDSCVDAYGMSVYAISPKNKVIARTTRTVLEVGYPDKLVDSFAKEVTSKYGKIAVMDFPSSEDERGLFSVYFPSLNGSFFASTISRKESNKEFEGDLTFLLNKVRLNFKN
jgi:hypothetical protein